MAHLLTLNTVQERTVTWGHNCVLVTISLLWQRGVLLITCWNCFKCLSGTLLLSRTIDEKSSKCFRFEHFFFYVTQSYVFMCWKCFWTPLKFNWNPVRLHRRLTNKWKLFCTHNTVQYSTSQMHKMSKKFNSPPYIAVYILLNWSSLSALGLTCLLFLFFNNAV